MSPAALGLVLGGVALVGVGVRIAAHLAGRRIRWSVIVLRGRLARALDRAAELAEELAVIKGDLAVADQALEEYREAVALFPGRLQRAYDAGQGAMLEQLTGLQAAEPWVPMPPPKWAALMQARENLKGN